VEEIRLLVEEVDHHRRRVEVNANAENNRPTVQPDRLDHLESLAFLETMVRTESPEIPASKVKTSTRRRRKKVASNAPLVSQALPGPTGHPGRRVPMVIRDKTVSQERQAVPDLQDLREMQGLMAMTEVQELKVHQDKMLSAPRPSPDPRVLMDRQDLQALADNQANNLSPEHLDQLALPGLRALLEILVPMDSPEDLVMPVLLEPTQPTVHAHHVLMLPAWLPEEALRRAAVAIVSVVFERTKPKRI